MFLKPIINLYYNERNFLQPQFWVHCSKNEYEVLKLFDVKWNFDKKAFISHVLYIYKPHKNDRNMPCNKYI
jgi:hypothetical protein